MKVRKTGLILAFVATFAALIAGVPAFATDGVAPHQDTANDASFLSASEYGDDAAEIKFGHNLLYAGNNVTNTSSSDGLVLSFGSHMDVRGKSEYSIAAANLLEVSGVIQKDLFAAGNIIRVMEDAQIGRDVYLAGNEITVSTDLSGNLAATGSKITFEHTTIKGDVNLSAEQIVFGEGVNILGTLVYNDDAKIFGLDGAEVAATQTYKLETAGATAAEVWMAQLIGVVGNFVVALILIAAFPHLKERVTAETSTKRLGANFLSGLAFVCLVPILAIMLMIMFFGIKAGLLLLGAWLLVICLGSAFTALWLGQLIVEKLFRSHAPFVLEAAVGILVLSCLALVPGINTLVGLFANIFGVGLMISCLHHKDQSDVQAIAPQDPKALDSPFRGQSRKKSAPKTKKPTAKTAPVKVKKSGKGTATKPARKPSQKK